MKKKFKKEPSVLLDNMTSKLMDYTVTSDGEKYETFEGAIKHEAMIQIKDIFGYKPPSEDGYYHPDNHRDYSIKIAMFQDLMRDEKNYLKLKEVLDEYFYYIGDNNG